MQAPAKNSLTLLGVGTCSIIPGQVTTSALIRREGQNVLFDIGRGVANALAAYGVKQDDLQHIVLSHFHPDHISDLIPYLHGAAWSKVDRRTKDLAIHGPFGVRVQIMRLLSLFGADDFRNPSPEGRYEIRINEVMSEALVINDQHFDFISLPPCGNHGIRFRGGSELFALTGDGQTHEELVAFLRGVDVAVIDSGHITDEAILALAAESQAKTIVCSHLYRDINGGALTKRAQGLGYTGVIQCAEQGMQWEW